MDTLWVQSITKGIQSSDMGKSFKNHCSQLNMLPGSSNFHAGTCRCNRKQQQLTDLLLCMSMVHLFVSSVLINSLQDILVYSLRFVWESMYLTRKLPSWVKGLSCRNLTATTLISTNGTGMVLLQLLAPEVVCQI